MSDENEKQIQKPTDELSREDLEKVQGGSPLSSLSNVLKMIQATTKDVIANIRS